MYAPNPSVKCSCNLQETLLSAGRKLHSKYGTCFNYINARLPAKPSFCYHCIHSLTSSVAILLFSERTRHTPSSSQVRSTTHDLTRSIQLYSRSNRLIMFTFHANVPKHHVTVAEYEQPKKYCHTQVNYEF